MTEEKWRIEYSNDVGPDDEGFWEWWDVTDGERYFKCDKEDDAEWLQKQLNNEADERLVMWAISLGFATGHADTEQDLLDEVGAQIKELRKKLTPPEEN